MSTESLQAFIHQPEDDSSKTLDGACKALHEAVTTYLTAFKDGLGRKTKDNSEWKRVVGKYYGISRVVQSRWDSVCDRVVGMGLLEIQESDGGRMYWKPVDLTELELHKGEQTEEKSDCAENLSSSELDEESEETPVSWDYNEESESEDHGTTWEGFNLEELEIIEIMNMAYLRGHTLYEQSDKPTFYDAHRWALVYDKPLPLKARVRTNEHGQSFGYCNNADGRYTGGLFNCAVMSASYGGGIMDKEEKELVKKFCMRPCENCPNKKYARDHK